MQSAVEFCIEFFRLYSMLAPTLCSNPGYSLFDGILRAKQQDDIQPGSLTWADGQHAELGTNSSMIAHLKGIMALAIDLLDCADDDFMSVSEHKITSGHYFCLRLSNQQPILLALHTMAICLMRHRIMYWLGCLDVLLVEILGNCTWPC